LDHFQTARKTGNSNCRQAGVLIVADQGGAVVAAYWREFSLVGIRRT